MINAIKNEPSLAPFIKQKSECCYDGKPERPYIDDAIDDDSVVALTPDNYYNSLRLRDTPPSVDHLVTLECHDEEGFAHFLIEDKNVKSMKGIVTKNVYRKFKTTLNDFMAERFGHVFLDPAYPICSVKLYLVTNFLKKPKEKANRIGDSTRLEQLLSMPPFKFRGIIVSVKHTYPEVIVKIQNVKRAGGREYVNTKEHAM